MVETEIDVNNSMKAGIVQRRVTPFPYIYALLLVAINSVAYLWILSSNELIGDVGGFPVVEPVLISVAYLLVVMSILLLVLLHSFCKKIGAASHSLHLTSKSINNWFFSLMVLQLAYLAFCYVYGVNFSGSGRSTTNSFIKYFWIIVNVDYLFLLSYPLLRRHKNFKYLVFIQIASSLSRGASGVILFVILMELSIRHRRKALKSRYLILSFALVLVTYPIINLVKHSFRVAAKGAQGLNDASLYQITLLLKRPYWESVASGFFHIVERIQLVSVASEFGRLSDSLNAFYNKGNFFPFWMEGIHGILYDLVMGEGRRVPIGTAFTAVGRFQWDFEYGDWNTNAGLAGWFMFWPWLSIALIVYVLGLCILSSKLVSLVDRSKESRDMLLFIWFGLLLPGWFQPFVSLIISQVVLIVMLVFLSAKFYKSSGARPFPC